MKLAARGALVLVALGGCGAAAMAPIAHCASAPAPSPPARAQIAPPTSSPTNAAPQLSDEELDKLLEAMSHDGPECEVTFPPAAPAPAPPSLLTGH